MKKQYLRTVGVAALLLAATTAAASAVALQNPDKKPVIFKTPSGYMAMDFPDHLGKLMLTQKQPAGMFVAYPKDGQTMASFTDEAKQMVGKVFLHDDKSLEWASASLPAHSWIESESGNLFTAADDKMQIQLAFYSRPEGVAYGYFAMRHKKKQDDDARFVDEKGSGVKAFDEMAKTISSEPKK